MFGQDNHGDNEMTEGWIGMIVLYVMGLITGFLIYDMFVRIKE